ncbi:MAG: hypothetical protein DWQ01_16950 [Planctomycetota bacterium]|nr:MAG: hypothetical protein DWQ01_16950 [Planctomycetota bacterium]
MPLPQEEIVLVNGKVLSVEKVTGETYKEVTFKVKGGSSGRRDADKVRAVNHDLSSPSLDDYVLALEAMDGGKYVDAIQLLNEVLDDSRVIRSKPWVVQHSLNLQIRCMFSLADFEGVAVTVDKLLQKEPNTFFYAPALMAKAEAKALAGDRVGARSVYGQLSSEISAKELPERWAREAELGSLLLDDSVKGSAKMSKLQQLVEKNRNEFPTVASRANVEIGNIMVQNKDYDRAQNFFEDIVKGGQADDMVEAAAYSGLGDVYYQRGLNTEDLNEAKVHFKTAALNHLRVALTYKDQIRLVPRSLFYAAESYHRVGGEEGKFHSRRIAGRLVNAYPRSPWAPRVMEALNLRGG